MSLVFALRRELTPRDALLYVAAQIAGGIAGTMMAHAMFALPLLDASLKMRTGGAQWLAEAVAAFGLIATILAGIRFNRAGGAVAGRPLHHRRLLVHGLDLVCQSGGCHRAIDDQYVFGHSPADLPGFIAAELCGAVVALMLDELAAARGGRGGQRSKEAQT